LRKWEQKGKEIKRESQKLKCFWRKVERKSNGRKQIYLHLKAFERGVVWWVGER